MKPIKRKKEILGKSVTTGRALPKCTKLRLMYFAKGFFKNAREGDSGFTNHGYLSQHDTNIIYSIYVESCKVDKTRISKANVEGNTIIAKAGKPYGRGRLSTVDLLVLNSLDPLLFQDTILFIFLKKQAV
jgi:hypothetical protein